MNNKKIAILGSTGFVGKVLLNKALEKGYRVKTLIRNPDKLGSLKDKVEIVKGSYLNPDDIDKTISGVKAVLSTVGPPQQKPGSPDIYETAMKNLVAALEKQNIRRLIHIGDAGHSGGENENWSLNRRILRFFLRLV
jgi:putative NADH-flavin reductase